MELEQAKTEVKELREKLEYYAKLYYDMDSPAITDYEYDMMMNRLKALEKDIQKATDDAVKKIDSMTAEKEKELLTV